MYNGEPLLELRLKLLYDMVDEFICVEARDVHSGSRQKQGLYVERFAGILEPYRDKLTILIIDEFPTPDAGTLEALHTSWTHISPESAQAWYRENYHRNYAADYVHSKYVQSNVPFVALVCDVDELPDPAIVREFRDSFAAYEKLSTPHHLVMEHYFYNFRWRYVEPFSNAYAVNEQGFRDMEGDLNLMRMSPNPGFRGGGWHGSYFLSVPDIVRKLESYARREISTEQFVDPHMIRRCLRSGCNILQQEPVWVLHEHNVSALPVPLQEFHRNLVFLQEHCG
ncbi:hypothetical protein JKP88DRAFT_193666 [Tribonema minus]|uniref:Uncharacterized protein n=1 Tax=Tribonema minus TaxID=303371 RepID=A0A835Z660_9STRA|nr:hypothetical protein JKP88DRAFT_193666 [Tribonema minus]